MSIHVKNNSFDKNSRKYYVSLCLSNRSILQLLSSFLLLMKVSPFGVTTYTSTIYRYNSCNDNNNILLGWRQERHINTNIGFHGATALSLSTNGNNDNDNSSIVSGIESTPNPLSFVIQLTETLPGLEDLSNSLRGKTYYAARRGVRSSSSSSSSIPESIDSILQIDGIDSVFAMATVLTINKKSSTSWELILPQVLSSLLKVNNSNNNEEQIQEQLKSLLLQGLVLNTNKNNDDSTSSSQSSSSSSSSSGQVTIRLQTSNKIPIQIEATGSLGTVRRRKLPSKFQAAMEELQRRNPKMDFFTTRIWTNRGIRYIDDDDDDDTSKTSSIIPPTEEEKELQEIEMILQTEAEEVDSAYSSQRLDQIIVENSGSSNDKDIETTTAAAASRIRSGDQKDDNNYQSLNLEEVDQYCDMVDENGDIGALEVLIQFVNGHNKGILAARRNALAYLGGIAGDIDNFQVDQKSKDDIITMVLNTVISSFQNEKSAMMRRTAGDALSDLGDDRAISCAKVALRTDRSTLVQWRAARILGEMACTMEDATFLKELTFEEEKFAFEVSFEIKDALRKVRTRATSDNNKNFIAGTGPMWKQIQEGTASSSSSSSASK